MGEIAAEVLIGRLADWGVDSIFGLPGDGINGMKEDLRRCQDRVRREELAEGADVGPVHEVLHAGA